jgi:type I restriction-modification system DNA methylase subunit
MGFEATIGLKDALGKLRMDDANSSGLRWISKKEEEKDPYIYLALEQASLFGTTAVYFRLFSDGRPPRPQIFIYDFNELSIKENKAADIHHHLWNAGLVPYCFIYTNSKILVYNCGRKPEVDSSSSTFITSPHDTIDLLSEIQDKLLSYSAYQFDSGLFWDSDLGKDFKYDQSAYEQLLTQLKNVKNNIISRVGKERSRLVKRVLMMLILIKYLEERKDEQGQGALNPEEFYTEFNKEDPSLTGVLNNSDTFAAVLSKLSGIDHFNGQIFFLSKEDLTSLGGIDLRIFQQFVIGNTAFFSSANDVIGQMTLWRLYQFNYLPIELISHIYEDFLADENGKKKKGVVYTPPYLVQFLIDKSMPLGHPKMKFRVLDPACGSGIFLVGAFKRMIQWWRVKNNWKKPHKENIEELKNILLSNIYGCDLEEEAIILTYFSLSLALLDALSPKEIWNNVHFDNLIGQNLFPTDFFKIIQQEELLNNFDLVIGNPPFDSSFTEWAKIADTTERRLKPIRPEIPDNQIALLFLEQSFKLLRPGGNCCLILPSGPLLYNTKIHYFKKYLFETYYFSEIFDFTPLRAKLFTGSSSKAKPAIIAVFAEKNSPEGKPISHLIFRRTRASGEKIEFEIDYYDIHQVAYNLALNVPGVWQTNFMGGGRLHRIVEKVASESTLQEYLDDMIVKRGWKVGEGWIESPTAKPLKRIKYLSNKSNCSEKEIEELHKLESMHKADWITGYPFVETKYFTENGIKKINTCEIKYFYRSAKNSKEIFQPPHLLIKEQSGISSIPIEFRNEYLTFRNEIIGISSPSSDSESLKEIECRLKGNSAYSSLLWLLSGRIITTREGVVLKNDILSLPYSIEPLAFDYIERILLNDISNYYSEFRKMGEKSDILSITSNEDLDAFGELYCQILNSVYKNFKPFSPIIGAEFIAYPFILGNKPEIDIPKSIETIEDKLRSLIDNKVLYNLWIKGFSQKCDISIQTKSKKILVKIYSHS